MYGGQRVAGPTRERVDALIDGSLEWVGQNLVRFDPITRASDANWFRSKAALELAMLCMQARRLTPDGAVHPQIERCVDFLERTWGDPLYQERVVREPGMFRLYAATYIALQAGRESADPYREVIQRIVDDGYATAIEEVPFRVLELRYLLELGGFRHDLPPCRQLYRQTLLAKAPPLLYLTNLDAYSITHTLFYLADLGRRPIRAIPPEDLPAVSWTVGKLLGLYLRRRNWDLVGELLLSCQCLRWTPRLIYEAAWESFLAAQLPDGSIPGTLRHERYTAELGGRDEADRLFSENYHTTLVGSLVGLSIRPLLDTPG